MAQYICKVTAKRTYLKLDNIRQNISELNTHTHADALSGYLGNPRRARNRAIAAQKDTYIYILICTYIFNVYSVHSIYSVYNTYVHCVGNPSWARNRAIAAQKDRD